MHDSETGLTARSGMSRLFLAAVAAVSALIVLPLSTGAALAQKRVALVVGNGSYQNVPKLANPLKDAATDAEIAVVYYAGHGIQVKDMNYMIPVDAKLATEIDAEDEAVSLDR